jgi:hypothetical protein
MPSTRPTYAVRPGDRIGVAVLDRVETDLAVGAIAGPSWGAALRPWGHARAHRVRDLTTTALLRPRRARCSACRATHVLLPGAVLPRRADTTAVIGTALLASASRHRAPTDRR